MPKQNKEKKTAIPKKNPNAPKMTLKQKKKQQQKEKEEAMKKSKVSASDPKKT